MLHQHYEEQHQEMVAFVKENRHLLDDYFSKADTVTIEYDKLKLNPMGGVDVQGYLNNDPKLDFWLNLNEDFDRPSVGSVTCAPEAEKYID